MTESAFDTAAELIARLEKAWNEGDGDAFAAPFSDDVAFIDIRGVRHDGQPTVAAGHRMIFSTFYKGSHITYTPTDAVALAPGVIVAHHTAVLECPTGPLAPVAHAIATSVLVRDSGDGEWRCAAFHNTLVTERG